jgi:asparagine synthase (glutamine-hydrolysing)
MCGIAGVFAYSSSARPVDEGEVSRIREGMANRGPDDAGTWISEDRRMALTHRRLAIIDLSSRGHQPMATADGRLRITFNGEIYNYRELRRELEGRGYRFHSGSDTEVLLHLYADRGPDMVRMLRGMYAFALWDEHAKGMFIARDPFGIKPLYYADDGTTFRVASQVKALLRGGALRTTPEPAGHVGFYLWGHVPEPYTLYREIRALEAGTSLWIDAGGRKEPRRFFSVTDEIAAASANPLRITRAEMEARLRDALLDTVRHHMIADVPVGVFLSAGLDSSTLTALATEIDHPVLHTMTLGFKEFQGTGNDEVPIAEEIARHYGTRQHTHWVTKEDFRGARQHLLDAMDQPSTDGVNSYFVSKVAADAGLKVALSGLGGDELFGGYPSFRQIPPMVKAFGAFNRARFIGRGFRRVSAPILRHLTSPKYAGLLEYGGSYEGAFLLRRGMYMPWELPKVLDPEIVREGWQELQTLSRLRQRTAGIDGGRLKVACLESSWYMRNQLLRDSDWASMAHSVEMRVPLVDIELFRATLPLLASSCVPGKLSMARTPAKPLPPDVVHRKKTGFLVPVREWLIGHDREIGKQRGLRGWARYVHAPTSPRASRVLALVTDAFGGHGGIAKFNRDLLTALANDSRVSHVTALPRLMPEPPGPIPDKVVYRTEALGGKRNFVATVISLLRHRDRFDLIVCGHINLMPIAYVAKLATGAPILLITHGIEVWRPSDSAIANVLARKVDLFISVSEVTKQRFTAWAGVAPGKGWILPNSVDRSLFMPGSKRADLLERYGLAGKTVLLTTGRLASEERAKGFDQIIELLPELRHEIPDLAYLIVGDGNDRARLEAKARQLGVRDLVTFAGYVSESEKMAHYQLADAYVMPSRGEGFGIVYLEAMACGIPTVGSAVDGSREALRDGELGILIDPDDPASIKRGILQALARPKCVPSGLDHFSFGNYQKRLHEITRTLTPA